MSIENLIGASTHQSTGEIEAMPLTPLSDDFDKAIRAVGFVEPLNTSITFEQFTSTDETVFNDAMRSYVTDCLRQQLPQHELSDIYPYRGILLNVAKVYYERQYFRQGMNTAADRSRNYQYGAYLREVEEDMRFFGEPANEHLDNLLYETKVYLKNFSKPPIHRFNTNIMTVLSKIDSNLLPIVQK